MVDKTGSGSVTAVTTVSPSRGQVLGGHGADERALPQEVLPGQPVEAASHAGQHLSAGGGVDAGEPDSVCAPAAGQFPERSAGRQLRAHLAHQLLRTDAVLGLPGRHGQQPQRRLAWGVFLTLFARHGLNVSQIDILAALYPGVWGAGRIATGTLHARAKVMPAASD